MDSKFLYLSFSLNDSFLDREPYVAGFLFQHFKYIMPLFSGLQQFARKKSANSFMVIPLYMILCFSCTAFRILSLTSAILVMV